MNKNAKVPGEAAPGLLIAAALLVFSGCATTTVQQINKLESASETPTIVLMPPDIRYYRLTAGGVPEPNAEWTESAQTNFMQATLDYAEEIGADVTAVDKYDLAEDEMRYDTLHSAVGSMVLNHYFGTYKLPSKHEKFDWSLGPGIRVLADRYDADYAMFTHYRDYQATGGRVAMSIFAALVTGYAPSMGAEQGFASLVDLKTGDIVWFNVVMAGEGELRDVEGAARAVRGLFKDLPTRQAASESQ